MSKVQAGAGSDISLVELVICALGAVLLLIWQIRSPGLSGLAKSPVRRNRLGLLFPVLQLVFWLVFVGLAQSLIDKAIPKEHLSARQYASYLSLLGVEVFLIALCLAVAWLAFARRLKGIGLNLPTVPKDLFWAGVNLLATYPLILTALWATIQAGKALFGPDFSIQPHQSLDELADCSDAGLLATIIFFTVVVVPFFEELLFRGMLQSALTGYLERPWISIVIVSALFASMHPSAHLAALFVLSVCLGYAYERSGSLLRSVFIHMFFNAVSVTALLCGSG